MRYTITELDCQLSEIIDCYDTDDAHDAWSAYVRMKNSASKIRYSEVLIIDRDDGEFLLEEF